PPAKRMKYEAGFKLKVVAFANSSNKCAAAREFGVSENEKLVRDWKKNESVLKKMPKTKCAMRTGTSHWPDLEKHISEWVLENRQNGYIVTRNAIRIYVLKWAKSNPESSKDFKATASWCSRFMERKCLVLRQKTKITQKLLKDLDDKITSFQRFTIRQQQKHEYLLCHIGNMDETPMNFDMPSNRTVDSKGSKTVLVKTTGHEKTRFMVVLACMANGTKLKPMVIFKRKTMLKIKFPAGVFVHVHEKGWMDEDGVKLWIDNVWNTRPGGLRKERSLLVWDMFRSHVTDDIKKRLRRNNTEIAVIPGGLTSVVQPLDVCLNKSFKGHVRAKWNKWMVDGEKTFTKSGNMRAAPLDVLCDLVIKSWDAINAETVIKSFKKCGISNSMDGGEDDLLWGDDNETETATSDPEWDPYDDAITKVTQD
uniref:HTH CENPB-type domain-containing protein n=1 Tax=Latimeria chalumnae TaxID=7897 RepID=H3A0T2_LATCH